MIMPMVMMIMIMMMMMVMMSNQAITSQQICKLGRFKLKEVFTRNQSSELTLHEPEENENVQHSRRILLYWLFEESYKKQK